MAYFARFEQIEGDLYRFDTRIYLADGEPSTESVCVGAVVGINPGSARPRVLSALHELELGKDKLLPFVKNRFETAYKKRKRLGADIPNSAFVQILNLFYLCNEDLGQALSRLRGPEEQPVCPAEKNIFPLTWYAWGAENELLAPLKQRFLGRQDQASFYLKRDRKSFGDGIPGPMEFAKHPRGMPAEPVEVKLALMLEALAANNSLRDHRP